MEDMTPTRMFIKNVRYLARIRGMQISEIEDYLHKSRGYLAGIYSAENRSLKLDDCVELAMFLQAPLQDMVYHDLLKVTKERGINLQHQNGQWVNVMGRMK